MKTLMFSFLQIKGVGDECDLICLIGRNCSIHLFFFPVEQWINRWRIKTFSPLPDMMIETPWFYIDIFKH